MRTADVKQVDLGALEKLHAAADLRELESVHITSQGYKHLANLIDKMYQEGDDWKRGWPVCMTKKEWSDSIAAAHNALPALIAELRALRELVGLLTAALRRVEDREAYPNHGYRGQNASSGEMAEELEKDLVHLSNIATKALAAARKWEVENV